MSIEDRLRQAIHDRTSSVQVDEHAGLERITDRLTRGEDMRPPTNRSRVLLAAAAVVLVVAVAGGLLLLRNDDSGGRVDTAGRSDATEQSGDDESAGEEEPTEADDPAETEVPPTTAEAPPTTTTPPSAGDPDPVEQQAVWPRPSSDVRFDDPVAAVRSFARFYAHFDDPVIGELRQGDARSGEVPVRPGPGGPETTVLVRQSQEDEWFVIASITQDITPAEPMAGEGITCPMATSGTALAFEGTVQVRIDAYRPDGARVEVGRGFVTGSGTPPAGPFSDDITCSPPSGVEDFGIVTFWTDDAAGELEGPLQIVTFPVRLP